jgi:putative ABC transport system permease protein
MKDRREISILSEVKESLLMALSAIAGHKLRSGLTLLGVLIGVFSIIVVMTAMRVLKNNIETEMSQLGANTFAIQKNPAVQFEGPKGWEKIRRRPNITLAQARQVMQKATLAASVGLEEDFWGGQMETRFQKSAPGVRTWGATPGSFPAKNWIVAEGRGLTENDVDNARDVCVLADGIAKSLFPLGSPVGERLKIDGINYLVIGTLAPKGASMDGSEENFVVVPITTGLNRFGSYWRSLTILVQARDKASYEDCLEQVRGLMRVARKVPPGEPDDFELFSNDSIVAQFNKFTRTVRIGVAVVSSIALLAAGIGIMNIMLVSVTERTREIGIRRAIGAKKRNIMTQFVVGGLIGVGLGILGGNGVALYFKVPPVIPVDWILLGLVICSVVGIVFGTYPAYKAANLDPIESLRYE